MLRYPILSCQPKRANETLGSIWTCTPFAMTLTVTYLESTFKPHESLSDNTFLITQSASSKTAFEFSSFSSEHFISQLLTLNLKVVVSKSLCCLAFHLLAKLEKQRRTNTCLCPFFSLKMSFCRLTEYKSKMKEKIQFDHKLKSHPFYYPLFP